MEELPEHEDEGGVEREGGSEEEIGGLMERNNAPNDSREQTMRG